MGTIAKKAGKALGITLAVMAVAVVAVALVCAADDTVPVGLGDFANDHGYGDDPH